MYSDMIDFGITEGEDLSVPIVSAGEKLLMLEEVLIGESNSKKPMLTITLSCPDEPGTLELKHYIMFPEAGLKDSANKLRKADYATFCSAFGLPLKFNPAEVKINKPRGWAFVKHEKYQGRDTAKIERFTPQVSTPA